jgi:hypothetical protein
MPDPELGDEIREALEEIEQTADYKEDDDPFKLRERLATVKALAGQALHDIGAR